MSTAAAVSFDPFKGYRTTDVAPGLLAPMASMPSETRRSELITIPSFYFAIVAMEACRAICPAIVANDSAWTDSG